MRPSRSTRWASCIRRCRTPRSPADPARPVDGAGHGLSRIGLFPRARLGVRRARSEQRSPTAATGWVAVRVRIVGGCCGLGPEHIAAAGGAALTAPLATAWGRFPPPPVLAACSARNRTPHCQRPGRRMASPCWWPPAIAAACGLAGRRPFWRGLGPASCRRLLLLVVEIGRQLLAAGARRRHHRRPCRWAAPWRWARRWPASSSR